MCYACGCSPCGCNQQIPACMPMLPQQESVSSQLQNLAANLFGPFQVTIVNGRGIWSSLCSVLSVVPGYPKNPGEGQICYIIRVLSSIALGNGNGYFTAYVNSLAQLVAIPTAAGQVNLGGIIPVMNLINPGQLTFVQLQPGNGGTWLPNDYNGITNNVSYSQVL